MNNPDMEEKGKGENGNEEIELPFFSEGGYSIWKIESEGQSDQKGSKESENPFVVKNFFGTGIKGFNSKEKAKIFVNGKISRNRYIWEFLQNAYYLLASLSFLWVAVSIIVSYFFAFKYTSQYGELWLFSKILTLESIKLFLVSFLFIGMVFFIPLIFASLPAILMRKEKIPFHEESLFNEIIFLLRSIYANACLSMLLVLWTKMFLYFFLVSLILVVIYVSSKNKETENEGIMKSIFFQMVSFFNLLLLYPVFRSRFTEKLNSNQWALIHFSLFYIFIVTTVSYFGLKIASRIVSAKKMPDRLIPLMVVSFIVMVLLWAPFFNFSRLTFSLTGIGAHEYSIRLLDKTSADPGIKEILKELKYNPGQKKNFCVFIQTKKAFYIVDPTNKKKEEFCSDPSFDGPLGSLVRVPIKDLASITPE